MTRVEQEVEERTAELVQIIISMVSHEFRTPLGIIQSSAEILENYFHQLLPAERQEHLQSIQKNTRRMASLMDEVLLFGKFEAGKIDFRPASLDLVVLVGRLIEEVLSSTENRCPIGLQIPQPLPREGKVDERLLHHIMLNLLTNAVNYSEAGQPVLVCLRREGQAAVLTVQDKGQGIPKVDQKRIFQAFCRARNAGDRPGTGLGLVIVQRCVDLHGGRLELDSAPGRGSTFTVRLPIFTE